MRVNSVTSVRDTTYRAQYQHKLSQEQIKCLLTCSIRLWDFGP